MNRRLMKNQIHFFQYNKIDEYVICIKAIEN